MPPTTLPPTTAPTITPTTRPTTLPTTTESQTPLTEAERILARLTLEQKIAQLFVIRPEDLTEETETFSAGAADLYRQYPVGGFILFGTNLSSPAQLQALSQKIYQSSEEVIGLPPILTVDEEGGYVARLAKIPAFGVPVFPTMAELGLQGDPGVVENAARTIGNYLKPYGFNLDFAPVADVLSNPDNQVVRERSFGSDPTLVATMVRAYVQGLTSTGLSATLKHFPGHGATTADTHTGAAVSYRTLAELRSIEFPPFIAGIAAGAEVVMVGHFSVPNYTGDDTPASLSAKVIHNLLRGELGFQGLVVSDALGMGAIIDVYGSAQAAVMAFQAGNDLLLMPANFLSAYQAMLTAVQNGTISVSRLDESVLRIIAFKLKHR